MFIMRKAKGNPCPVYVIYRTLILLSEKDTSCDSYKLRVGESKYITVWFMTG